MKIKKKYLKYYISIAILFSTLALLDSINISKIDTVNISNNIENENIVIDDTTSSKDDTKENIDISPNLIQAYVKRVVDGDTIVVVINNVDYKVRMIGINTPESTTKTEEYGKEASNYTTSNLTDKTVYLEKDVNETDKYGRLLRYIWLEIPTKINEDEIKEKMFNSILLINGYAQIATYPPDVKYVNYFKSIQNIAKDKNIGLWGL